MRHESTRSATTLPRTVNLHLVAHCNYACGYCYGRFEAERTHPQLPLATWFHVLAALREAGARRITFAGGEPTLHPQLDALLRRASDLGLVTSVVTNGSLITEDWLRLHGPHLRWLTLSIDSIVPATAARLGRRSRSIGPEHLGNIVKCAELIHNFNAVRPDPRRIRIKINITVTKLNAGEDPRRFLLACRPEKVKLLQMLLVAGENDDAAELACEDADFTRYVDRVISLRRLGIDIVVEDDDAMDGSYAMLDPLGRFFQRVDGTYVRSRPIHEVGVTAAWTEVGGYDAAKFVERGGDYDPGLPARGNRPYCIAIEGLDGCGKSTIVAALAAHLGATIITNPPAGLAEDRSRADALPDADRRAWYRNANAEAARQCVAAVASGTPVIMDRSVATTLAFAAAEQGRIADPSEWPDEIPRPDLLLLLDVPEVERRRRLDRREQQLTLEERRLLSDDAFRNRVLAGYAALGAWRVPGAGSPSEVVRSILALVRAGATSLPEGCT